MSGAGERRENNVGEIGTWMFEAATLIIPLAIAIVFHEVAHGRVAHFFGDPTAANAGRLSFNPVRHIDPVGTIALPLILGLFHLPIFGWAKPVPVMQSRLRNPRWHMVAVAAAGPLMNIALAFVVTIFLFLFGQLSDQSDGGFASGFMTANMVNFLQINVFLAIFNMLPIPPFDGSKVLAGLLPPSLGIPFQQLERRAMPFVIMLLVGLPYFFPKANIVSRVVFPPANWLMQGIIGTVSAVLG
jgi:Zn-dependent protease